jgi:hypothetical protein
MMPWGHQPWGLNIMKQWSQINIGQLKEDRCFNITKKVLRILDGLFTYWTEVFQPLPWPTYIIDYPLLFLSKLYFAISFMDDIDQVTNYFELPHTDILLCISKIITKNKGDSFNRNLLHSMYLKFLENVSVNNLIINIDTLNAFNDIFRATTITLWNDNLDKNRLAEATLKLNSKMEAECTSSATVATSVAINRAITNLEQNNTANDATQLRISILE